MDVSPTNGRRTVKRFGAQVDIYADPALQADAYYIQFVMGVKNAMPVDREVFDELADMSSVAKPTAGMGERDRRRLRRHYEREHGRLHRSLWRDCPRTGNCSNRNSDRAWAVRSR